MNIFSIVTLLCVHEVNCDVGRLDSGLPKYMTITIQKNYNFTKCFAWM